MFLEGSLPSYPSAAGTMSVAGVHRLVQNPPNAVLDRPDFRHRHASFAPAHGVIGEQKALYDVIKGTINLAIGHRFSPLSERL